MSLKNFVDVNSLFYKIYLRYNLYIRHKAHKNRKAYSQWGEDSYIKDFFNNKKKGFYVDIGCFHPILYSNTCLLHNEGWEGINIDANQTSIDLFNISRPNDHNICAAISDKKESRDFFIDHLFSPVNTIEESFFESANKSISFKNLKKKKVETKTFSDVVKGINDLPEINFLNIDCEGHDCSVLNSFNLKKHKPELICIETHEDNGDRKTEYLDIINILDSSNYKIFKRCGPSSIFVK